MVNYPLKHVHSYYGLKKLCTDIHGFQWMYVWLWWSPRTVHHGLKSNFSTSTCWMSMKFASIIHVCHMMKCDNSVIPRLIIQHHHQVKLQFNCFTTSGKKQCCSFSIMSTTNQIPFTSICIWMEVEIDILKHWQTKWKLSK